MARTIDLDRLRRKSIQDLEHILIRVGHGETGQLHYTDMRWICAMSAVEAHSIWERYAENRLAAALNHDPRHFISEYNITGVTRVSTGLALFVIRGGGRYFDFRSMSDLLTQGNKWLGRNSNPFRTVGVDDRNYLDTLAAIRNMVVHASDSASNSYKRALQKVYGLRSVPSPGELLDSLDRAEVALTAISDASMD